jgi:CubicO group peptidase (beta-lactamase class C family)
VTVGRARRTKRLADARATPYNARVGALCSLMRRASVPPRIEDVLAVSDREGDGDGTADRGRLEAAWDAAEALYESGIHPAIQLCVRHRGTVVLDRSIGYAAGNGPDGCRGEPIRLVTPDTPFCVMSASKPVTAMVVHLLAERGLLRLDDPVCRYLPDFARHRKERITIRQVLLHRAGIPTPRAEVFELDRLRDPDALLEAVCDLRPSTRPGRVLAYHAVTGGFVLGALVERVAGRSIRAVLRTEIAGPLGCRWLGYGVEPDEVDLVARNYFTGLPVSSLLSGQFRRVMGFDFPEVAAVSNDPRFLTGIVPAGNVVTTANELSLFYQVLLDGGATGGVRLFAPDTVRTATTEAVAGEVDRTLLARIRYSLGFMLGGRTVSLFGPDTYESFGHLGFTNIIAWADPARQVAATLMTSGKPLIYPALHRVLEIPRQIGLACPRSTAWGT